MANSGPGNPNSEQLVDFRRNSPLLVRYLADLGPDAMTSAEMSLRFKKAVRQVMTGLFERALFEGVSREDLADFETRTVSLDPEGVPLAGPTATSFVEATAGVELVESSFRLLAAGAWEPVGSAADDLAARHAASADNPRMKDVLLRGLRGNFAVAFATAAVRFDRVVGNPERVDELIAAARRGFKSGLPRVALDQDERPADPLDGVALERSARAGFNRNPLSGGCCLQYEVLGGDLRDACSVCPRAARMRAAESARTTVAASPTASTLPGLLAG